MSHGFCYLVGVFTLLLGTSLAQCGVAEEMARPHTGKAPSASGSVNLKIAPMPPTKQFIQPKIIAGKKAAAVDVPQYPWGYFGARYHYTGGTHVGYYGDTIDWWFPKR